MNLFPTADDKRQMGESVLGFDVGMGMEWLAQAALQDHGATDAYKRAIKEWEAAKPSQLDFLPAEVRAALEARREAEMTRVRAESEALWGHIR